MDGLDRRTVRRRLILRGQVQGVGCRPWVCQQARALVFPAGELKALAKGRGLMLMQLDDGDTLETLAVVEGSAARICGTLRTGREDSFRLEFADYVGKRAKKGKLLPKRWVITAVEAV